MELKREKQVKFGIDGKQVFDFSWEKREDHHHHLGIGKQLSIFRASSPLIKSEGGFNEKSRPKGFPRFGKNKVFQEGNYDDDDYGERWILDPGSETVIKWNKIFLFFCLTALFVDPLFFYLPSVLNDPINNTSCMKTDNNLAIIMTCFRTVADVFYVLHVIIKFRIAYVSPNSRAFGKGELVMDLKLIATKYLKLDFFIDIFAALPLPQILIWIILPAIRTSHSDHTNNSLLLILLFQYIPRLYLIFPLSSQIIKATGVVTKTAWAGAAYNLLLYLLASHILGASWYVLSIERDATCWKSACRMETTSLGCSLTFLDCGSLSRKDRITWANKTAVFNKCNPSNTIFFNYGIFGNAVSKNVFSTSFFQKYFYCLWWGLQNLSSYGQPLSTSTFIGETAFAILIAIMGLVLFAHLIGNMQTYLQSLTVRLEEWRLRRRDTEEWMKHRKLPQDLQERVRRFVQYKWLTTRGVNEESILQALPTDLRRDIQRHLCLYLVRRVPFFSQMDDILIDAICEHLVSSLSTQGTYMVREGDPVTEMLFVIGGTLESSTTNGGRTGFFNSITLRPGDFCGEELLAWALLPKSALNYPSSTRTVRALTEVEAFALKAEDLKFVANQFRRLHSKKLQHTFRYYSHHWRTWSACFIQAAWRRYKRREMAKTLMIMQESFYPAQDEPFSDVSLPDDEEMNMNMNTNTNTNTNTNNSPIRPNVLQEKHNLGITILASRFAANTRRGAQKMKDVLLPKLQKPEDPDFSADPDEY